MILKINGMQQKDLAETLGVSPALISKIVRGSRTPSDDIVARISQIFGISKEYLTSDGTKAVSLQSDCINSYSQEECLARSMRGSTNPEINDAGNTYYNSQYYADSHMYERVTYNRYEDIKRIAVGLYCKYDITSLPVNPFKLAHSMGIDCIQYKLQSNKDLSLWISNDGYCRRDSTGKWSIFYNDEIESSGRIHYTIMHEIGHIVLHHTPENTLAEREADFFAKYMLCPPAVLYRLNYRTVGDVVNHCGVSYEAASYALDYCRRWLAATGDDYTPYEVKLLDQLGLL
ncbi:MAG: XRE family transcriptional regulator [Clostridia bacterium]|nr:XRE family transcriptional regulator [Clostridia bacterium]